MTALTMSLVGRADATVQRLSLAELAELADEIYAAQPNLLASVLVHARLGATTEQLEILVHCLLVTWVAMKASKRHWPLITAHRQQFSGVDRVVAITPWATLPQRLRSVGCDGRAHAVGLTPVVGATRGWVCQGPVAEVMLTFTTCAAAGSGREPAQ